MALTPSEPAYIIPKYEVHNYIIPEYKWRQSHRKSAKNNQASNV